jgi:hypothetical protein
MNDDRLQVLNMLEAGQLSANEAVELLDALNGKTPRLTETPPSHPDIREDIPQVGSWWLVPTGVGAIVMALGAPLLALGLSGRSPVFWALCCGWLPFLIGLTVLTIGVWSRSARWLHLRIRNSQTGRMTFAISMPLPLTLSAWVIRVVRPFVPQIRDIAVEEMIMAVKDGWSTGDEQPIFIEVQDDDDGEHILIYIG